MSDRSKQPSSYRLSPRTKGQLEDLARRWGMNQSEILALLIDRAHREDRRDTVKTVTVHNAAELAAAQVAEGLTPTPQPTLPCEVTFSNRENVRFEWQRIVHADPETPEYRWDCEVRGFSDAFTLLDYLRRSGHGDYSAAFANEHTDDEYLAEIRASDEALTAALDLLRAEELECEAMRRHND